MNDECVEIRALEPEDLEYLYKWENDMDLWDVSDTLTPFSHFTLKKYIDNADKDIYETKQLRMMIVRLEDNMPVGLVDLYDFDPYHMRAGIGIMIHNMENRKQGYASSAIRLMLDYCFETLGLHQVYSSIPSCNIASLKLFESLGVVSGVSGGKSNINPASLPQHPPSSPNANEMKKGDKSELKRL